MNSIEVTVYRCRCGKLYNDAEAAEKCCAPRYCTCGNEISAQSPYTICGICKYEKDKSKATILSPEEYEIKYPGHIVYSPDQGSFYDSVEDYLDYIACPESDDDEDTPFEKEANADTPSKKEEYLHGTIPFTVELDIDSLLDRFLEEASTEDRELEMKDLTGVDRLREAINEFNRNNAQKVWYENREIWVRIPSPTSSTSPTSPTSPNAPTSPTSLTSLK